MCYSDWVCLVNVWAKFTDLVQTKQWPALVLLLTGKALEATFELADDDISGENGIKAITDNIVALYKKDKKSTKDLQNFKSQK